MSKDKDYKQLMSSANWQRLRRYKLSISPQCERCRAEGKQTPAEEVHHIKPVEDGLGFYEKQRRCYDFNNLQSLCRSCHVKTHTEMGRSGKPASRKRNHAHTQQAITKLFGECQDPASGRGSAASEEPT